MVKKTYKSNTKNKNSNRKKASPKRLKSILKKIEDNKKYRPPTKVEKTTKFLKENAKFIPHILGAIGSAYILREIYKRPEIHKKIIRFNILNGVNVYKEINITKNNTEDDIKTILSNCIFHGHPDKNNGKESKGYKICSELSQYLFNKKIKKNIMKLIEN